MQKPVKAKVAQIIDNRSIAISAGTNQGVEVGMVFRIYSHNGLPIVDPDSGEELGALDVEKYRVKVSKVYEKFAIAETFEYETVNMGGNYGGSALTMTKLFEPPKLVKKYRTFDIKDDDRKVINERDSSVHVGDIVEQVLGDK